MIETYYGKLSVPMPGESLSSDTSRGFALTSIKAAYVIERLNQVFGLCGYGWRYSHTPEVVINSEVVIELALQYRVEEGVGAVNYIEGAGWVYNEGSCWSEPVYAFGGKTPVGRASAQTDARKSAVTDGLTKAASMVGVGIEVFKGQSVQSPSSSTPARKPATRPAAKVTPDNRPDLNDETSGAVDPTTYYRYIKGFGSSVPAQVSEISKRAKSGEITWEEALTEAKDFKENSWNK